MAKGTEYPATEFSIPALISLLIFVAMLVAVFWREMLYLLAAIAALGVFYGLMFLSQTAYSRWWKPCQSHKWNAGKCSRCSKKLGVHSHEWIKYKCRICGERLEHEHNG